MDPELRALRARIRSGAFRASTSGLCPRFVQANLVVVPERHAADFRLFCERNSRPCPLIEQTEPGGLVPRASAPTADIRTDVPRYRVYRHGELVAEPTDVVAVWREDLVSFLLGCSFTFEHALAGAGIPLRHQDEGNVVPMYVTNRRCQSAGGFSGPLVVSMRPVEQSRVSDVYEITSRFPLSHGAPIHSGDPSAIGIARIAEPDFGEPVSVLDGEVPVFWGCGVTAMMAAVAARPDLLITHAPGHMFLTDLTVHSSRSAMAGCDEAARRPGR
ncbi:MAG TPA: putative hydro-lyase [Vicinamibacteria bacterium]|nr:putative hydro-lyase [Vicinamibacteria bacterium]